ncbi:TapB family protein [Phaeodactylibacter luteus]|uniref:DUF3108 domain-containing protein n=1 Tax=Phaeodactylibacter luteus TaxID=1564516 RepID=A0A5C6RLH5_9BACT|nr:hypothetical protein [Phaeodactylibacter luteus]TXB62815.1 hypothetical protein FRY97_12115 [Phaeodactylibacter luteus]
MQLEKITFLLALFAASFSAQGQDLCNNFFPFKEGVTMEYTTYSPKGKVENIQENTISAVATSGAGLRAEVVSVLKDKKGKEQFSGTFEVLCQDNQLLMDVNSMLNPAMQQSFDGMEVTVEGDALSIPATLNVGEELPDASTTISAGTSGLTIINMTVRITNRKVEAKEKVTTAAGTFDCYKISQESEIKMMMTRKFKSVEYYADGVGVVRSESYSSNGKLETYMELTAMDN